jgi:hypothetical protein
MATRCALGNVLRLAGRTNEAVDAWRQLLAGAEQTGNHLYAARIQKEIAKFEAASEAAGT